MNANHEVYVPGHVPQKVGMLVFGLVLILFGLWQLAPKVSLVLRGSRAEAVAVAVVKQRPGSPDLVVHDDAAIVGITEKFDRTVRFWNVFTFADSTGKHHEVRLPSPSLLQPAYPIADTGGLPYSLRVAYDPNRPERYVFHTVFSTWVFPVLVVAIGLLTSVAALLLLRAARRPIEMPVPHNHDE